MAEDFTFERQHYLITPADPVQRDVTDRIERACRNHLLNDYKIRLNAGYMTTFACVSVEAIVRTLSRISRDARSGNAAINFLDLFTVASNNRFSDEADKDGNINIQFIPGTIAESIMERDYAPVVDPEVWQKTILNEVEKECAKILTTRHKAVGNKLYHWTIIAFCYFEYLIRTVKLMAKTASEEGNQSVSFNFLEMMEWHCTVEKASTEENPDLELVKYTLKIRPGFQSKLLIKNDDLTEVDD